MIRTTTLLALLLFAGSAFAENPTPHSGTQRIDTGQPFATYLEALEAAVQANGLGIVARACADCGAKTIGKTIPGNRVIMVFAPPYAVRMLAASVPAGIEAPLRLYVTERPDGTARLTYRLPSHTFEPYDVDALDALAAELDVVFAKIVEDAGRRAAETSR